jgi:F-type H+-transporting ATPase subunit delta
MTRFSRIDAIVEGIISYLEDNKSLDLLPEIAQKIVKQSWVRIDPNQAFVHSRISLTKPQKQKIQQILSKHLKRPIRIKNLVDRNIIAGLKISVAGQVIDGTINTKLKQLKNQVVYG